MSWNKVTLGCILTGSLLDSYSSAQSHAIFHFKSRHTQETDHTPSRVFRHRRYRLLIVKPVLARPAFQSHRLTLLSGENHRHRPLPISGLTGSCFSNCSK